MRGRRQLVPGQVRRSGSVRLLVLAFLFVVAASKRGKRKNLFQKRERPPPPGSGLSLLWSPLLVLADVLGLQALRSLDDVELHAVALHQRPEALHLNGGVVDEYVLPALLRDEAEAFAVVEPLHRALRHVAFSLLRTVSPPCPRRVVPPIEIGSRTPVSDQRDARTRKHV